nr:hypothetical protein [Budvicia aquatica]
MLVRARSGQREGSGSFWICCQNNTAMLLAKGLKRSKSALSPTGINFCRMATAS